MRALALAAAAALIALPACSSTSGFASRDEASSGSSTPTVSESRVRKNLGEHGYSNISDLHETSNGWSGAAIDASGKPVDFNVDHLGAILVVP